MSIFLFLAIDSYSDIMQRLKSALWLSIGKIVDEETIQLGVNATPQFIGALTEMVWAQIGVFLFLGYCVWSGRVGSVYGGRTEWLRHGDGWLELLLITMTLCRND